MDQLHSQTPTRIGEFTIVRPLADGRHSRVYLGESAHGHQVAVKVMDPAAARDRLARQRFSRGVDDARRVRASIIPRVVAADAAAPQPWVATEYLAGPTLAERLTAGGPLTEPEVLGVVADVANCLLALHEVGLVHGELEPSKIVLTHDGARVVDVGANAQFDGSAIDDPNLDGSTVGFLAPEQVAEDWVGSPADIFALGAVAFCAATGRPVFGTGAGPEIAGRIVHDDPDLSHLANPRLRGLIWDCLAKEPTVRPRAGDVARFARPMSAQPPPVLGMGAAAGSGATAASTLAAPAGSGPAADSRAEAGPAFPPGAAGGPPADRSFARVRRILPAVFGAFVVAQIGWAALSPSGQADNVQAPSTTTTTGTRPGAAPPAPAASATRAARPAPSSLATRRGPARPAASPAPAPSQRVLITPLPTSPVPGVPLPVLPTPVVPRPATPAPAPAAPTTPRAAPTRPEAPRTPTASPTSTAPRPTTAPPAEPTTAPPARPTVVPSVEPTTEPTRQSPAPVPEPPAPIRPSGLEPVPTAVLESAPGAPGAPG